jgi:Peptidase family M28/WD40-like Beta Propeller Repeat
MIRRLSLIALLVVSLAGIVSAVNGATARALANANDAWERGDYISALNEYIKIVESPDGDAVFDGIALQTGELFETRELTSDGRNPRFSPDGRYIAYETGLEVSRHTRIVRSDGTLTAVADLPGVSATFSSSSPTVAYLTIADNDEVRAAAKAVDDTGLAGQNRNIVVQTLEWQITRNVTIVARDLNTGQEKEIPAPGLQKTALAYAADGRTLYFLGAREGDDEQNDFYSVADGRAPARLGDSPGLKTGALIDPTGTVLIYTVPGAGTRTRNPFRKPQAGGGGGGGGDAQGGAGDRSRPSFGVIDLASNKTRVIEGTTPSLSADGKTVVYIARSGLEYHLMLGGPLATAAAVKKTTDRLDAPAVSPDGQRIAYQAMSRDDWDIFVAARDGSNEKRLTRDIQHDLLPRFTRADRLLEVVGEARHRRSYLYDLTTSARVRLFHNNTVRTIAPEYQWVVSGDSDQVLIGAERDGNTVSPERGVYLVDLRRKITKPALLARLRDSLASETSLRASATKTFAPIAGDVKQIVESASSARVFSYEKALFDFDSKHISRPGNRLASEYLFNTYASFGYEPAYQWFAPRGALDGKTANVVATLRGTVNPELVYVVSSHYDSVAGGPGADDDTSGTAALLEAARVMAGHPMPATIVFASFTGEEAGLLGSREFVRRAVADRMQIVGALNNDMVGFANDHRLDNTIRYSNPGIRDIQHGAAMLFTRLITYDALYFKSTDAASYYDAYGDIVGGIGSYPVLSSPHYHQSHDLLEFENHDLITETSKTTVATLMLLASSPSRINDLKVESFSGGVAALSWTPSPEKGVTSYVVAYGLPATPLVRKTTVKAPSAKLTGLAPGTIVSVKAVNNRGLEGWDWARVAVK